MLLILALCLVPPATAIELTGDPKPGGPAFELKGAFADVPKGESRYLTLETMLAHPDVSTRTEPFVEGEREAELTVLPFASIMEELPYAEGADAVIIRCKDGWMNYYTKAIVEKFDPFVVLLIDGEPPASWPIDEAMREHLSPFYIHISTVDHPTFYTDREYGMMNPSAAIEIEAIRFKTFFAPLFSGPYAAIEPGTPAHAGRKRYLNNCMACHRGPGEVGGVKSDRPFQVLKAQARYNPEYFKNYVRDPQKLNPVSEMIPHPHFDDVELDAIIAFLEVGEL